jgi:hypothetical protein
LHFTSFRSPWKPLLVCFSGFFSKPYVELGSKGTYQNKAGDDKKTDYKIFFNCDIFYAETEELLKSADYCQELLDQTVIISL